MNFTPEQLGIWILILIALLPAIREIRAWFGGRKPPIEAEFATKAEVEKLIDGGERRSIAVHERINDVLKAVCRIEGRLGALPCAKCEPFSKINS